LDAIGRGWNASKGVLRPTKPAPPGTKAKISTNVLADLKNRVDAAARASGREQGEEWQHRVQFSFDFEDRFGGPRVLHLLGQLAAAAQELYPDGDAWLDDRDDFSIVLDDWLTILQNSGPVDVEREIAIGRQMVAELPTLPRHLQWRMRSILATKAQLTRLPSEVRAEFAAAAKPPEGPPPSAADVDKLAEVLSIPHEDARRIATGLQNSGPDSDELDDALLRAAGPFMQAWLTAATLAAGARGAPDDQAVAEYFAQSRELHVVAGLRGRRSPETLLRQRAEILALIDKAAAPAARS
jgi:hypothetical protein